MVRRRRRAATLARLACSVPSAVRSRFGLAPATSCSSTSSNSSAANASAAVMVFVHWCSRQRVARQDASLADLRRPCASARRYRPNRRLEPPALEAALRQLRLRWNVGKCGFLVPRLGLDDLPFPDNLNIRASLASLRIPFSAEEVRWSCFVRQFEGLVKVYSLGVESLECKAFLRLAERPSRPIRCHVRRLSRCRCPRLCKTFPTPDFAAASQGSKAPASSAASPSRMAGRLSSAGPRRTAGGGLVGFSERRERSDRSPENPARRSAAPGRPAVMPPPRRHRRRLPPESGHRAKSEDAIRCRSASNGRSRAPPRSRRPGRGGTPPRTSANATAAR